MFCPRCGAESDEGSRYCASCGAELPKKTEAKPEPGGEKPASGERLSGLVGRDRRTRMVTLGTLAALAIAVVAFLALDSSDEEDSAAPPDAYTRLADAACIKHKSEIAMVQRTALTGGGLAEVRRYADSLVPIVGTWRLELNRGAVPADRADRISALAAALLEVEIEAGTLARVAGESDAEEVTDVAARVDAATTNVEGAIDSLGLERCGQLTVGQGQAVGQ